MHTTTGTGKKLISTVSQYYMMFAVCCALIIAACCVLTIAGCSTQQDEMASDVVSRTPVHVVTVKSGNVSNSVSLLATTAFTNRNAVTSPLTAFIVSVHVRLGDNVKKGQLLYVLQTKESRALGDSTRFLDGASTRFGIVNVKAPAQGVVSTLDKQQAGDYVLEGTQLCTIAQSKDLVFQVNVPYEHSHLISPGSTCSITLPDGSVHTAKFSRALSAMNPMTQTQVFLASTSEALLLPENMIVGVKLKTSVRVDGQVVDAACVQSNEMLTEYWVQRMIDDTTSVKTVVTIGNRNKTVVEILTPTFPALTRLVGKGSYGLPDTANVAIVR